MKRGKTKRKQDTRKGFLPGNVSATGFWSMSRPNFLSSPPSPSRQHSSLYKRSILTPRALLWRQGPLQGVGMEGKTQGNPNSPASLAGGPRGLALASALQMLQSRVGVSVNRWRRRKASFTEGIMKKLKCDLQEKQKRQHHESELAGYAK